MTRPNLYRYAQNWPTANFLNAYVHTLGGTYYLDKYACTSFEDPWNRGMKSKNKENLATKQNWKRFSERRYGVTRFSLKTSNKRLAKCVEVRSVSNLSFSIYQSSPS